MESQILRGGGDFVQLRDMYISLMVLDFLRVVVDGFEVVVVGLNFSRLL